MIHPNLEPPGHGPQPKKSNDLVEVLLYVILRCFYNEFGVLGVSFIAVHEGSMVPNGYNFLPLYPLSTSGEEEGDGSHPESPD
jgi:hypothetical protein